MSTASKSPRKVAAVALEVGTRTLPRYGHRFSRKDFTLAQLFACLVLRKFFKTDYRGICAILVDCSDLQRQLGLAKVPHFTTLQKAELRLLRDRRVLHLLDQTLVLFYQLDPTEPGGPTLTQLVDQAAADSTGFELDPASRYFVKRRARSPDETQPATAYRHYGKLGIICDCDTHLILATHRGYGPKPDVDQLQFMLDRFCPHVIPEQLLADGGFDSQANHERLREVLGIESWIPPAMGRPTDKLPTGSWRFLMATAFDEEAYGQRWQAETVMFMLKRHQGSALTARRYPTRRREMGLIAITHNIMIVLPIKLFYRATSG